MLIKSITYKNFRQFLDTKIEFSTDPKKNTTVILAGNTNGKSTVVESFRWCFYNEINLPKPKEIANKSAFNELNNDDSLTVSVKVELIHQNVDYSIERTQVLRNVYGNKRYNKSEISIHKKNIDGVSIDVTNKMDISEIVPEELMSYFFFTGERFNVLVDNKADGKKDISNAVKSVLGLKPIEISIEDLKQVKDSYRDWLLKNNWKINSDLPNKLKEIEEDLGKLKIKLNNLSKEKEEVTIKKDELFQRLKNNPNEQRERKLKEINEKINEHSSIVENCKDGLRKSLKKLTTPALFTKLYLCNKDIVDSLKPNENKITGIDVATLRRIISEKKCICGREIIDNSEEFLTIKNIIDDLENSKININEDLAISKIKSYINHGKDVEELFFSENLSRLKNLAASKEQMESFLMQQKDAMLYDENQESFEKNKEIYEKYLKKELDFENQIEQCETDIINKNKEKEQIDKEINKYFDALNTDKNYKLRIKYCDAILQELSSYYKNQENIILAKLNSKVSDLFEKLIKTKHTIEIDSRFKFRVKDIDGTEATSDGADVLTAMAFIGGLISLAKENDEALNSYEPYPLVLDSPFGKLEKTHQQHVSELLPSIPEQFVLLVSDSQFSETVSDALESKIGKMWIIETEYSDDDNSKKSVINPYSYLED